MKIATPVVVTTIISALVITLIVILIEGRAAYVSSRDRCIAFPKNYSYIVTRFHQGNCQFKENEGWITFNPAS